MNRLVERFCNCDSAETWHKIHRADCGYFAALAALRYENGIAANLADVLAGPVPETPEKPE